ncbi:uncharacterized protein LOC142507875 [Primulina tabacum]|uniref:uncharacterized protein LOC142507875 n=1 Tax=Primulina tabacum TaxID=48773 RepID=UPI003F59A961
MGGKIDSSLNQGGSPPVFKLHGQNYHLIGSLLPCQGVSPKFAQLYIYDTENEISNRISAVRQNSDTNNLHFKIISDLKDDQRNNDGEGRYDNKLKLIGRRCGDGRRYNLPSASEVAALIVGDFDESLGDRDILVETQTGKLKRINELNPAYLALQYPLFFPYGEDGYREDISFSKSKSSSVGRKKVDIYPDESKTVEMYKGLHDALLRGETNPSTQGKRIILPSTFTEGARYMIQNYQDAMAICKWAGYPDLFITFTCNPKWLEIVRFVEERGLKPEDRPDIVCRIFKIKLDALIKDLRNNKFVRNVKAVIYTVEFQKRGLPHAHILLFLCKEDKYPTPEAINGIISAEIPYEKEDPVYYGAVCDLMMHDPCGDARKKSACMSDGRCTKNFPKKFVEVTSIDEDGYPVYRRRDNAQTILKNGVNLDNIFVVPHNHYLLIRYGARINAEWCNQSRAIKYLFKYINKGHDRVTASFYQSSDNDNFGKIVDEVNMYYDCRYISPCEAAWRIFGFEIQYRDPPVERLSFHLPNEQNIIFSDIDQIDTVLERLTVNQSMFLAWMEANKKYPEARELLYAEFPMKFVWKRDTREFVPRKKRFSIGRIFYVPPGCGDMYYLRFLLNVVRGPTCYDDISIVNGVQYRSFRDACYALGLLNDDKEYIDGIVEASHWASAQSLRVLFATLLSSDSISRPDVVWESCWTYLSDDILYKQRNLLHHQELELNEDEIKSHALVEIEKLLRSYGKSLRGFQSVSFPSDEYFHSSRNSLIHDEMRFDRRVLFREHHNLLNNLNDQQRQVYNTIMTVVDLNTGGIFFVYGYGALDKSMKDIMGFVNPSSLHMPFGRKKVVFGGDFRQILPVFAKDELLLKDYNDPIATIVESTYPLFRNNVNDAKYFQQRAILAPTLDVIQSGPSKRMATIIAAGEHHNVARLYEAWERYKELLRRCPNHGFEDWVQIELFYNGLNGQT